MSYVLGQSLWSSALSSILSQVVDLIPRGWGIKMAILSLSTLVLLNIPKKILYVLGTPCPSERLQLWDLDFLSILTATSYCYIHFSSSKCWIGC